MTKPTKSLPIAIDRARWWTLSNPATVFYGSLATHLVDVLDESIPTAATDGKRILWNPDFVAKLTDEEVRFILLHEALHCAHAHFDRLPLTSEGNEAGDYAINLILQKIAGITMPKSGLLDQRYKDMAEEEILADLAKRPKQKGRNPNPDPNGAGNQPSDTGGCGVFIQPDRSPNAGGKSLREKWEEAIIQGEIAAKALGQGQGSIPADMQRILDRVRTVDVNWQREMADFARTVISDRADWSRSTRRMATAPVIYPRRMRDRVGTIVVVRDTSGSIDRDLCNEFSGQVTNLCADLRCSAIVLDCDTRIHAEYRLDAGDECPLEARGGGGTDFVPAFDRVRELIDDGENIAGMIYLTDLDGSFPDEPADYPVLWAAYNTSGVAPFGRTIHVKK
jgi:predicted metal-dependent peptidase